MPVPTAPDAPLVREGRCPVPGAELQYRETGSGAAIVVLHGGPDFDYAYLLPDLDRLARDYRLVYYAQRGRGASRGAVRPADVTLASELSDLDALRTHLGLDRLVLLGHSWGALLALEYALARPEPVSHLVLLNPAPASRAGYESMRAERARTAPDLVARMAALAATPAFRAGELAADEAYYRVHYGATVRDPGQAERLVRSLRANFTPEAILVARSIEDRLMDETWRADGFDRLPTLARLRMPTLVVHGDRDFVPVVCARQIADAIPGARFVLVPDSGHFSYLDAPAAVHAAVRDFLG